jgi:hypothetical protein
LAFRGIGSPRSRVDRRDTRSGGPESHQRVLRGREGAPPWICEGSQPTQGHHSCSLFQSIVWSSATPTSGEQDGDSEPASSGAHRPNAAKRPSDARTGAERPDRWVRSLSVQGQLFFDDEGTVDPETSAGPSSEHCAERGRTCTARTCGRRRTVPCTGCSRHPMMFRAVLAADCLNRSESVVSAVVCPETASVGPPPSVGIRTCAERGLTYGTAGTRSS